MNKCRSRHENSNNYCTCRINSWFDSNDFQRSYEEGPETLSYCGVGTHLQESIGGAYINNKVNTYRTFLMHSNCWPSVVHNIIWFFSLKTTSHFHSALDLDENGLSPIEFMNGMKDDLCLKSFHTLWLLVFVLDHRNQSDVIWAPKLDPKSRIGVFLCHSQLHASNVTLGLNLKAWHISPRHYFTLHDEFFTLLNLKTTSP